jgi:hypothetical protein
LATSIALSPLSASQGDSFAQATALAGTQDGPGYRLSIGYPSRGFLDRHHSVDALARKPIEASLYAIRNVLVEDLLKTRAGLRELMNRPSLDFRAPREIRDLYLNPSNPGAELSTVAELIRGLDRPAPKSADARTRQRLIAGLLFYSAQIVQAERVLKFLTEDWYESRGIAQ